MDSGFFLLFLIFRLESAREDVIMDLEAHYDVKREQHADEAGDDRNRGR